MKKKLVLIISIMLMIVALAPVAGAKAEVIKYLEGVEVTELSPDLIVTDDDTKKEANLYEVKFPEAEKTIIMPLELSDKGGLYITLSEQDTNYSNITATLYKDEACKEKVGNAIYLFSGEVIKTKDIAVDQAGRYYLKFEVLKKTGTGAISFPLQLTMHSGEDQELLEGAPVYSYQDYNKPDITYKIEVKAAGFITLSFGTDYESGFRGKLQLLDKNKKALSAATYASASRNEEGGYDLAEKYYVVAKGTYYITLDTSCKHYGVFYELTEIKDSAGTKKDKAKALKLGGTELKGICTATDATTNVDWYSFKLTKDKSIKVTINSKTDGKLKVELLNGNGKPIMFGTKTLYEGDDEIVMESNGKFTKGTYFIKIYKYDKTSSGYYTVKVK